MPYCAYLGIFEFLGLVIEGGMPSAADAKLRSSAAEVSMRQALKNHQKSDFSSLLMPNCFAFAALHWRPQYNLRRILVF